MSTPTIEGKYPHLYKNGDNPVKMTRIKSIKEELMKKKIKETYKIAKKNNDTRAMIDCINLSLRNKEIKKMKDYTQK